VTKQGDIFKRFSDHQLMRAVAGGNLDAFKEIVFRYQNLAWKTAFRFLGDAMEAEDVAQESFINILKSSQRYRPTAAFRTYFYRVVSNLCIDRARKKRPFYAENPSDVSDLSADTMENLIEKERRIQVRKALDLLSSNQKAAMILRHYEELNYSEIAQILDITPKAVERLIGHARTTLQAKLLHIKKNKK
jgi:RNA polymerase sigma-70 factor (ECF subfamily)